jgi:heme exporter protein D
MEHYFGMGGYADFIWPSYIIVAVVMIGLVVFTRMDLLRQRALLEALEKTQADKGGARKRAPARPSGSQQ